MWITDVKHFCSDGQKYNYHAVYMDTPIGMSDSTPLNDKKSEISKIL